MSYNLGLSKQVLYRLKRTLGVSIQLVQVGDSTLNFETGVSTPVYTILNIDRAIKMPASMLRLYANSFAGMAGGGIDFSKSVFILDATALPTTLVIDLQDYVNYDGKHWQISMSELSDDRQSYVLQVEALESKLPEPRSLTTQGIGFAQTVAVS